MDKLTSKRVEVKISLITVSYNSSSTIQDTFDSIRKQTYPNIEYIVVDGGSNDNTVEIIKSNSDIISKWISEKDNGIFDAFNKGISLATGEFVGILNSDDFYIDEYVIENVIDCFITNKTDSLYGNLLYVNRSNTNKIVRKWIEKNQYKKSRFKYGWMPAHPTFFVKRSLYNKLGYFDTNFKSAGDYELMLRFLYKENISSIHLPKILVKMRAGGNSNQSLKSRIRGMKEDRLAWLNNDLEASYFTSFFKIIRKFKQFI